MENGGHVRLDGDPAVVSGRIEIPEDLFHIAASFARIGEDRFIFFVHIAVLYVHVGDELPHVPVELPCGLPFVRSFAADVPVEHGIARIEHQAQRRRLHMIQQIQRMFEGKPCPVYSTLLPVRKKDIVLARIFTVIFMQVAFILIQCALFPLALLINNSIKAASENPTDYVIPGLGPNSFVLLLGIAIIGYAIADLIFFPIYYKHGKSIVMSTLFTILGFVVYIGLFTIGLPYIPGLEFLNNLHIGIQFAALGGAILISFGLHVIVYHISAKRLEKVDF